MAKTYYSARGWLKDPMDTRDFEVKQLVFAAAPLPAKYIVYPSTYIYDQGSYPACVGYSCAGAKTDEEFIQYHRQYIFDALWLYKECKKLDGIPNVNGTFLRVAMKILAQAGMREKKTCLLKKTSPDIDWQISSYYRIPSDASDEAIKRVIFEYGTICIGSEWYDEWMNKFTIFPSPKGACTGGHAWRIIGWNETGWTVANSWGKSLWGAGGIATMPYDVFEYCVKQRGADIWKLVDK